MGRESTTVRLPLGQARSVLLARSLEEAELKTGKWSENLSDRMTAQAAHEQGEGSAAKMLAVRAEAVLRHFRQKGAELAASPAASGSVLFVPPPPLE